MKYNRWILFYKDGDLSKKIVAFSLLRTTEFGLKAGLSGTDGAAGVKTPFISFKVASFNTDSCFGEISGRLEELIVEQVPVVNFKAAKKILEQLGKTGIVQQEENHYIRKIGELGVVKKVMVGLPEMEGLSEEKAA